MMAEKTGQGVIARRAFIDMTGNPAVVGEPVDRWLCGPCFRKVCIEQWAERACAVHVMSNSRDVMSQWNSESVKQFRVAPPTIIRRARQVINTNSATSSVTNPATASSACPTTSPDGSALPRM